MDLDINKKDLASLLLLYNQEVETLKTRLQNGESWEGLNTNRNYITTLSIALYKKGYTVEKMIPSEFTSKDLNPSGSIE